MDAEQRRLSIAFAKHLDRLQSIRRLDSPNQNDFKRGPLPLPHLRIKAKAVQLNKGKLLVD
jgi:hypothetical protein